VITGRSLQQDTSLSNSNGCLGTIPRCEANACVTRSIKGVASWACLRCLGTYEAVIDSSGQDNIIQCGEFAAVEIGSSQVQSEHLTLLWPTAQHQCRAA
jgi:hypothetical protein